jgi:hypothetical protein
MAKGSGPASRVATQSGDHLAIQSPYVSPLSVASSGQGFVAADVARDVSSQANATTATKWVQV